ncbi:LCP family protein [Geomicrobium sp. JCM 19038]|uniref:LCP family glycopolymer transferase n=1 Tax=Geomicrobium sp. JCM 19038 TaxID=1460635 RepID=UPI00045F3192|nr:LCP family protein [Geomicrobium sp. JCM 19038]GAK07207.1 cell envelope-associated transcriptional attenuator LytR-CpsA-Psr [Geomicrobium sp. JCM 19038]
MAREQTRSLRLERKRRRKKRIIVSMITLASLAFIAVGVGLAYTIYQADQITRDTDVQLDRGTVSKQRDVEVDPSIDNISVLFLGVDNRDGQVSGISDAIVLATFNHSEQSVKMLSIPRDSYVSIPGREAHDKINHAHSFGGTDLAVETVENFIDVPVDYYVTLNFQAFIDIVNTFGGVDVDASHAFSEQDADGNPDAYHIQAGEQTLTGEEALAYVRHRKSDGDLARGERQTEVIQALIEEATSVSNLSNYSQAFQDLQNNMKHNFGSFNNISAFHNYVTSLDDIERHQLEGEGTYVNGVFYFDVDDTSLANSRIALRNHLELDDDSTPMDHTETAGEKQND